MGALLPEEFQEIHDEIIAETEKTFRTSERLQKLASELDSIAFSNIVDFVKVKKNGRGIKISLEPLSDLPKTLTQVVKKIKKSKDGWEIELHSKMDGIHALIDLMGIKPAQETKHSGTVQIELINYGDKKPDANPG